MVITMPYRELKERNLVAALIAMPAATTFADAPMRVALPPSMRKCRGPPERADAWIAGDRWILHELFDEWNHRRDIKDIVDQAGRTPDPESEMDVVVILPAVRSSRL